MHFEEPDSIKVPFGQGRHEVLFSFGEVPAGQLLQEVAPFVLEKVPSGHFKHSEAPSFE